MSRSFPVRFIRVSPCDNQISLCFLFHVYDFTNEGVWGVF